MVNIRVNFHTQLCLIVQKSLFWLLLIHSVNLNAEALSAQEESLKWLSIPVRIHIVENLSMRKKGVFMNSQLSTSELKKVIIPEVNLIWKSAKIRFSIESIVFSDSLNPPDKNELIDFIIHSKRNQEGKSDPVRIKKLNRLINWKNHDKAIINVYFVPFLGESSQGNANRKSNRIFLGLWSDKSSKGKHPPKRQLLIESRPFNNGSLARTFAHELGHILKLKHPKKERQSQFGLLMGGRKPGYQITREQVRKARKSARKLLRN